GHGVVAGTTVATGAGV
ncbi:hypothetical protein A2U01_0078948, partial [Trifolium medium]|nr:hypothetical protein [Trifolium medium]